MIIIDASCSLGIVKVNGHIVTPVTILTQGQKASTGKLIIDKAESTYIATNTTDIQDIISQLVTALGQINVGLTAISAAMTGPTTAPPPTLPTTLAAIAAVSSALSTISVTLK